jgi:hypothetical protein
MVFTSSFVFLEPRRALRRETAAKPNPKCYGLRKEKSTRSERADCCAEDSVFAKGRKRISIAGIA